VERKLQTVSTYSGPSLLFGEILLLVVEATNTLLTIPSRLFLECVSVNTYESEHSKIDESGHIYESRKITSGVNLILEPEDLAFALKHFEVSTHNFPQSCTP